MIPVASRDSEGVLLLVWRVDYQAIGRYGPLNDAESGHVIITKIENLHNDVEKFTDSKNAIRFDLRRKITKLSRKTV